MIAGAMLISDPNGTQADPTGGLTQPRDTSADPYVPTSRTNVEIKDDPNFGRIADKSQLNIIKFPENLGNGVPYMLFKIFETQTTDVPVTDQTTASLRAGGSIVGSAVNAVQDGIPGGTTIVGAAAGGALAGTGGAIIGGAIASGIGDDTLNAISENAFGVGVTGEQGFISRAKDLLSQFNLKRNVEQLSLALALFMPDGITTNYDNEYEALSVTATLGAAGFATQALAAKDGAVETKNPYIMEAAAAILGRFVGNEDLTKLGLFATTGMVRNPQLEMIYNSPVLRRFTFDFRLIPKNANESAIISSIIRLLKYYAAPQIPDGLGGRYLIPPAQFEIEFYDANDQENVFLFKTKKCVLSGISIDYSPNGFATFADGAPVETRLQLTFQETVIIDRQAVLGGY